MNIVMAMLGGAMVPAMFMPELIQNVSLFSPVRWAIQAIEGAVWRDFSWPEMLPTLAVLVAIGGVCFMLGTLMMKRQVA